MKITFLVPPPLDGGKVAERIAGCAYGFYPIPNILILTPAAVLEQDGHEVTYEDFPMSNRGEKELNAYLVKDDADVYCFYTVNLSKQTDLLALSRIRMYRGETPVIFFGPTPSNLPHDFTVDSNTFVVRGEPELSIKELITHIEDRNFFPKIRGITYRDLNRIIDNEFRELISDLDQLPFPARHLIAKDMDKYYNPKLGVRPFTAVLTSRNCPYRCIYCVPCSLSFAIELEYKRYHSNKKPPVRLRSAENVVQEIKLLSQEGYKSLSFLDDLFIWGERRTVTICEGIKYLGIEWGCATRVDHITENAIKAMAEAKCKYIDLGVESFDQRILDYIKKDLDVTKIEPAVQLIKKYGIKAKVNILVGCGPLETKKTIKYNRKMVRKLDFNQVMYNIFNPFPGTEIYKTAKEEGWFIKGDYYPSDVQKEVIIKLPHLSPKKLKRAVRIGNLQFFLRPKFIIRNIREFATFKDFIYALKVLKRKLV